MDSDNGCENDVFESKLYSSGVFVWKIKQFSKRGQSANEIIKSPDFSFLDTQWRLYIYGHTPFQGIISLSRAAKIVVWLARLHPNNVVQKVITKFYFQNNAGEECLVRKNELEYKGVNSEWCLCVEDRKKFFTGVLGNLLHDDTLTVCCEIMFDKRSDAQNVVEVADAGATSGDLLTLDGSEMLGKSLESLWDAPCFFDAKLKVGEKEFPVHKAILASRSPVFRAMFEDELKEKKESYATISEMETWVAEAMLRYIYGGRIEITSLEGSLLELYAAADQYDIPDLLAQCRDHIVRRVNPDIICDVVTAAALHNDPIMKKAANEYLARNAKVIVKSTRWASFTRENPDLALELLQKTVLM